MKIVGRRFWTWMSLWALTFFVKGDLTAGQQEKETGQVTNGTSSTKHKVPLLKTQVRADVTTNAGTGMSKAATGEKTQSSLKTQVFPKTQSGLKTQSALKTQSTPLVPGVGKIAKMHKGQGHTPKTHKQ